MGKTKTVIVVIGVVFISLLIIGALMPSLPSTPEEKPAVFEATDLTIYPVEATIGRSVQISVIVKNVGDLEGTYTVILKIDAETEATTEVALDGGTSESILFTFAPEKAGTCDVEVNGLTGRLDVVEQIKANVLYLEYEENEVAADLKYEGHILYVDGEIISIGKDILDRPYIVLAGDTLVGVQCIFDEEHETRLAQLTEGDWVIVRGRCEGLVLINVLLEDCSLVD